MIIKLYLLEFCDFASDSVVLHVHASCGDDILKFNEKKKECLINWQTTDFFTANSDIWKILYQKVYIEAFLFYFVWVILAKFTLYLLIWTPYTFCCLSTEEVISDFPVSLALPPLYFNPSRIFSNRNFYFFLLVPF